MDKIGVVILNYKNYDLTNDAITSLVNSKFDDSTVLEFYIVDNRSENDSLEEMKKFVSKNSFDKGNEFHFIQSNINGGYAKGVNQGIRSAVSNGCDYIATVNPDITVKEDSINELHRSLKGSDYGIMGPKIYDKEGNIDRTCARKEPTLGVYFFCTGLFNRLFPNNHYIKKHYIDIENVHKSIIDVDIVSGAFMLFKRSALIEIDYFDENTFLYNEEMIISERLKMKNYKTGVNTKSFVYHLGGGSSTNLKTASFLYRELLKSSEYYLSRYKKYPLLMIKSIVLYRRFSYILIYLFKKYGYVHIKVDSYSRPE